MLSIYAQTESKFYFPPDLARETRICAPTILHKDEYDTANNTFPLQKTNGVQ
jgi:hypothetical protein